MTDHTSAYPLSNVYRLTIPVTNYNGDGIYEQAFYFQGPVCPTKALVLQTIAKMIAWNAENVESTPECAVELDTLHEAHKIVSDTEFPFLRENQIFSNNFVQHPKFGRQPITLARLFVHSTSFVCKGECD